MRNNTKKSVKSIFFFIVFPTILATVLFVASIFLVFIPSLETQLIDAKKEMIKELTHTAWSIFQKYDNDVEKGTLEIAEAQKRAISEVKAIRYGHENLDYFWITDMNPKMIMHPYREDLNGKDLTHIEDSNGKKIFVECAKVVKTKGFGYENYMWQYKDDENDIVPKVSYVKGFEKWGWIVGTGIYMEDVELEIKALQNKIILISLGITLILIILFGIIVWQSLKIDNRRVSAELSLLESREKYKIMVEAVIEGSLMIIEDKFVYSNRPIQDLLCFSDAEFFNLKIADVFPSSEVLAVLINEVNKLEFPQKIETLIKTKNGEFINVILHLSLFELDKKKGFTIIVNDARRDKLIEEELSKRSERIKSLANSLNIGIFKTTFERKSHFIEANSAALKIFGYANEKQLLNKNIYDLFFDEAEKREFLKELAENKSVKNKLVRLLKEDGTFSFVFVSIELIQAEEGSFSYFEGVIDDVSLQKKSEKEKDKLIYELQTSQNFLNQPIIQFASKPLKCFVDDSVARVAEIMTREKYSVIVVETRESQPLGVVTESDFKSRVVNQAIDNNTSVFEIMSAPIISVREQSLVFETILLMNKSNIRHVAIKNIRNEIKGVVSLDKLSNLQFDTHSMLVKEIKFAKSVYDLEVTYKHLPGLIKALINSGVNSESITRAITMVSDTITEKLIGFVISELGEPPVKFAFISLGSEGRKEQTLKTDQDNAIVFEDVEKESFDEVQSYFLQFSNLVCNWLNQVGYDFCLGEIMAKNPKWNQPLYSWKQQYKKWFTVANAQDIIEMNIFFDFRCIYGSKVLVDDLSSFVNQLSETHPEFFIYLAENAVNLKSQVNVFGKIVLKGGRNEKQEFDTKESMALISNYARIYALKNNIQETNTLVRLELLYQKKILHEETYNQISGGYKYLLQLRLKHQASLISMNKAPDNCINSGALSHNEISRLTQILKSLEVLKSKLSFDFKGVSA